MTEENEVDLKPCPFCGSDDIDAEGWRNSEGITGPSCNQCGASAGGVSTTSEENILAWNIRAAEVRIALLEGVDKDQEQRLKDSELALQHSRHREEQFIAALEQMKMTLEIPVSWAENTQTAQDIFNFHKTSGMYLYAQMMKGDGQ